MLKVMVNGKVVQGTKVVVQNGDKIVLTDTRTGQSPIKMVTKKVGKSLHIFEEGAQEPSLVLEDYYAQGIPAQVSGIDASGGYVNYAVADSGSMELMSGPLEDTAAGEAAAAATTTAAGTGLSTAAMVGLGALGVGAVALAAGGGGSSNSAPAPTAPAPDTTAPAAPTIVLATDAGASSTDGVTNVGTINVTLASDAVSWQYQIDGGTWTAGTGTSFTASAGVHTYAVRQSDAAGNVSTASTALSVTLDTTVPTPLSMSASGTTVAVTFSEAMDTAHLPTNAFSVLVNNAATTVSNVSVSGTVVTLTIDMTLTTGTSVQVGYADPTANTDDTNAIQDTAGNDAASFLSGVVADGYVRGAEVWIDVDGSGTVDPGVDYFVGTTDSVGNFFIPDSAPSGSIIATGGVNIDTGVPNTMPLRAPEGSTVINPLTTLVQAVIESDTTGGTTVAEASASVVAALGLTSGTDLTTYDPISEGDVAAQQAAATVATIISLATAGTTDTVATITTNTIISNLVTEIQTSTTTTTVMDLADSTTLSNLITGVVLTDTVQSSIADASAAIQTAATLSDITTAQSVALDTVGVGASTLTVAATTNDTTPTVHVNLSTTATDGTAAIEGDTVILKADGIQVGTATLSAANILAGYVNITTADLSEGAHSLSAVVIDQAGNMGVSYPVKTVTVDTIPPAPSAINVVAADDIINALEAASGVTITGVISAGSTVTVNGNPAVVSGTTWSYVLDAAAITAMGEGSETITVIATDLANNSVTTTKTISIDTLAPTGQTIGMIAGDNAINAAEKAAGVAITGTAEAGAIVTLSIGGNLYKITADTTSGTWSHTLAAVDYTAMGAGSETITATATDAAGNTSSLTHTITIDTTAPLLASFVLETASDSGIKLDGKSNITAPQFKLTAELGSTLEMKIGTGSFANVGTGTGSTQTITAPAMVEGSNVVVLRATDAAGNVTERTLNYTLDTTAPAAPIMLNISPDSGAADGITNVKDGVATGTAEANSTVNITINGTPMAAVTTDALGNWSMPYTNLPDGTYTAIATVTDAAGNISGLSVPVTMIVDTTIATPIVSLANDTAGTTDHITSDASLTLSTAAIDVTRTFTVDGATAVSTYTAPTADGSHTVLVTDTDTAGNVATASLAFTLDTVLPTATISLSDLTITKGETANVTITFSEVPSGFDPAVDLAVYGGSLSAGSFDLSGKVWTAIFTPTDDLQVSGSPIGLAGSAWTDTAGNASVSNAWSQDASIDTHAPTATITMADGALKIGETSLVTITFNEPITNFANDDVTVANGTLSTLISSNAGMTWTAMFTPTAEVTNTSNVITLANTYTDIAGNTGTAATSANYTIDTAIATPAVALATNSGSTADTITNDASLTLSPLAIDVTRTFTVDGGTASGSYVAPTTDGSHTVLVTDTDTAGNIATASLTFTLDKTVSAALVTITGADDNVPSTSTVNIGLDATTNDNTPVLKGTIGATLVGDEVLAIYEGSTRLGEATLIGTDWSFATASLVNGTHSFTARVEDLAGNTGTSSTAYGFTVDATVPTALATITSTVTVTKDTTPTISGALSAPLITGEVVKVYEGTTYLGNATVTNLTWSFTTIALSESTHTFTATVENAGGNQSQMSTAYSLAIDITAPAAPSFALATDSNITADGITNIGTVNVTGIETGATWQYSTDGGLNWSAAQASTVTSFTLAEAAYAIDAVQVKQTDVAGNTTVTPSSNAAAITVDALAPSITMNPATADNILNAVENSNPTKTITGTTTAEDGQVVTYKVDGIAKGTGVVSAGAWTVTFAATAPYLSDGTHVRSAEVSDIAGNIVTVSSNFTVDATAPIITISAIASDDVLNAAEVAAGGTITGTTSAEDGRIVTVKVDGFTVGTATVTSGAWSLPVSASALGTLAQGSHLVTADVSDTAGNPAVQATHAFSVDTVVPTSTISNATSDNILNAAENIAGTKTITGISDAENGSTVIVKIDGNIKGTTTVINGAWSLTYTTSGVLSEGSHIRSAEITDTAGNIGIVSKTFSVDTIAPSIAATNPIVTNDNDVSGTYSTGDTLTLRFSESVNTSTLTLSNLVLSTGTWGTSTIQSFDNTSVTIQLASDAVVAQGATVTISQTSIVDSALNPALADLVYTIPVPADTTPPSAPNFYFNEMTNQVYLDMYSIETGATWEYQINGGTWTAGEGNSFIVSEINGDYTVAVRQTDAALNVSATSTDMVTVGDNYSFSTAALIAPESTITTFPAGATFTDGYVTILFNMDGTTGTITEPNGAVHVLSIVNGAASATVDGTTYTYKMLASDGDMMVLGQTDTDLMTEMNGEVQGPPPVWTLINTAATADALPTSGTTTFYTTDTDNFGDRNGNDWTKIAFDFSAKTLQGFALDSTAFTPEIFTVTNNQIIIHEPSGNYDATITQIGAANGFYAFSEEYVDTRTWGSYSAYGVSDMSGYLSNHSDYLWQENGTDYNKNGTTDDYGKVIRDIDGNVIAFEERYGGMIDTMSATLDTNALAINWGGSTETYSIDDNVMLNDTSDNEIKVVEVGTNVFSLATANPFSYSYTVDGDTTLPTITSASVNGSQLFLTFSEPLDYNSQLPLSMITVMVNGITPVATFGGYPYGNNSVQIYLGSSVLATDTVTISYADPMGNNANVAQDTSGNDLATVINMAVANVTGLPTIYISQMSGGVEGTGIDSAITFQVSRSGSDLTASSSVAWAVSAGTADAADFVGGILPSGTVTFAANETMQTITIPVAGDWIPEENETFSLTLSNPINIYLNGSYPVSGTITNDDQIPNALILGSALTATETDITAFTAGTTFTDGYVTMAFDTTTTGTVTEPNSTVQHAISLSGGIATATVTVSTNPLVTVNYTYKMLTSSTDVLVLAQTDLDLMVEMNGYVDGPMPIWTLINTAAIVDAIPTTGILTLFDTDTDNYGDLNGSSDVKITFDFDNQTAQHYAIDGTPTFLEHFSVFNNTMIFDDGAMKSYVTLMANSAGYYTFKENYIEKQNWGTGSAQNSVDISAYLSATSDILWSENGMDYNGNGTIYDYGMVTRSGGTIIDGYTQYTSNAIDHTGATIDYTAVATLGANALVIDEGDRISTYSVTSTNLDPAVLTDNAISVVTTGTEVFTFAETNPFSISYAYEMDMGSGTVGVGLHDGMALNVATDLGYTNNTLFCINSVTDTAANTITISIADVLAQGVLTDLTPQNTMDNVFVNAVGINAGANDIINATGGWTDTTQTVTIKGIDYSVYADANMTAQLYVSNSITPSTQVI